MPEDQPRKKGYHLPEVFPTREEVIALISAAQLPRLENTLIAGMKNAIRLHLTPTPMDAIAPGASHIGGIPDLPAQIAWPHFKGQPMTFLAQLSCADFADYDTEHLLPSSGILSFFVNNPPWEWADYDDPRRWAVYYDDGDPTTYQRVCWPDAVPRRERYTPCTLKYSQEIQLPPYGSEALANLDLSENMYQLEQEELRKIQQEADRLWTLSKEIARLHGWEPDWRYFRPRHQSLGYPESIQHDVQYEALCNAPRAANLKDDCADANAWVLLLQVDTCDEANIDDWVGGRVFFMIHHEDLARRDFSAVWMEFQND